MKVKKIVCLAMAATMALPLVACGDDGDNIKLKAGKTSALTVEYLQSGYGEEVFEKLADAYMEKYPEVQVELHGNPNVNGDTETKLSSGKNIRDVYYVSYWNSVRRWAARGWVESITDVYSQKVDGERTVADALDDHTVDMCEMGGQYWAIPNEASIGGFIYNEAMFEEYGWEVPTTTKELETLCKKIVKDKKKNKEGYVIKPFVYCGAGNDGYWNSILNTWWLQASGAAALDSFAKFESPEVFKDEGRQVALELLNKFAFNGDYLVPNTGSMDANKAQRSFLEGKAAMLPCGSWFETEMKGWISSYPDVKYKMMATPVVSDENGNSTAKDPDVNYVWDGGSACWFVTKASNRKENAKNWMAFLCSKEANDIWVKYTGATRGLDYDVSSTSDVYKEASDFSKSILDLKSTKTPYKFITKHPVAIQGYLGMWPQQRSPFIYLKDAGSPDTYFANDYDYVSSQWDTWNGLTQ